MWGDIEALKDRMDAVEKRGTEPGSPSEVAWMELYCEHLEMKKAILYFAEKERERLDSARKQVEVIVELENIGHETLADLRAGLEKVEGMLKRLSGVSDKVEIENHTGKE